MNIKRFTKFSSGALALLLIGIGTLVFHSLSTQGEIYSNERHRFRALLLADELLQSSDDLTRMARTYVITGDPLYEHYFDLILGIRSGVIPRPKNYSATYWHLAAAGKTPAVEQGEPLSLMEMFRQEEVDHEEFALLAESLARSDELVKLERQAFAAVKGLYTDGEGNFTVRGRPDREFAMGLLFGQRYIAQKAAIMEPLQQFLDVFNERMHAKSNLWLKRIERHSTIEIVLVLMAVLGMMLTIFYTRRSVLQPLAELGRQVAGITRGILPSRYGRATNNEVTALAEALATADAQKKQLLENERSARNEAERASQLKDEFLATVSHELRTPLNAILGWAQLLQNGKMKQEDVGKGLEIIQHNASIQGKLIEDLLEMSSIISGRLQLHDIQQINLIEVIDAAIESVRLAAETKKIVLQKTVGQGGACILGNATRLQQIFWNLLSNAIKFTPLGGRIEIIVEQTDSYLQTRISDSGIGIPATFLPYAFDRFRQADASLTRQYGGLGLGLAIVKELVEAHGGRVRAESAGVGKGATFIVNLLLATSTEKMDSSIVRTAMI